MNKNNTNFFESVAKHNLERFHSETIAWIFSTFPIAAKNFIKLVHKEILFIDEIVLKNNFCTAEDNQIDIQLQYTFNSKSYKIFIENKMKASEHSICSLKLENSLKKMNLNLKDNCYKNNFNFLSDIEINSLEKVRQLSQTEYYYLREKINHSKEIIEKLNKIKDDTEAKEYLNNNSNFEYCRFIYLKPSTISEESYNELAKIENYIDNKSIKNFFDFQQYNHWDKNILGVNPWKTITYKTLSELIIKSQSIPNNGDINCIIANSYLKFINTNIDQKVDLASFSKNTFGQFDYFKLLFAIIKSKFVDTKILYSINKNSIESDLIYEYIEAGSSNGGMPLFAFFKKLETDEDFIYFSDTNNKLINKPILNVGVQVQGENFKYYVSADDYDNTKVNDQKSYKCYVESILKKITDQYKYRFPNEKDEFPHSLKGFNSNKTKTFYSRSYKILGFVESNNVKDRNIFEISEEISNRVNDFLTCNIKNI